MADAQYSFGGEVASGPAKIAVCAFGFVIFGAFVIHGPFGAPRIEASLASLAQKKLAASGHGWARAEADGQAIVLSGKAPDDKARKEAVDAALTAIGPGGAAFGAVTKADASAVTISLPGLETTPVASYRFDAEFADGKLALSGMAPSESARASLFGAFIGAAKLTPSDATSIVPLADESAWLAAAAPAMHALSVLEEGAIRQRGETFALSGVATSRAVADTAESLIAGARGAYAFDVNIRIRPPAAKSPIIAPAEPAKLCQAAINRAQNGRRLTFRHGSAFLSAGDHALLDAFAGAIAECDGKTIAIEGHTDSTGIAESNLLLSQRRAEVVKDYLDRKGLRADYLVRAYGETRPIASNSNRQGQQRNRRIDFVVDASAAESD